MLFRSDSQSQRQRPRKCYSSAPRNQSCNNNAYCQDNEISWLDWSFREKQRDLFDFVRRLIAFRKAHPALRMTSAEDVNTHIENLTGLDFNVTGFHILPGANGEEHEFVMIFNPRSEATMVTLPEGKWDIYVDGENAGLEVLGSAETEVSVAPISAMVLVKQTQQNSKTNLLIPGGLALGVAATMLFLLKKFRKK